MWLVPLEAAIIRAIIHKFSHLEPKCRPCYNVIYSVDLRVIGKVGSRLVDISKISRYIEDTGIICIVSYRRFKYRFSIYRIRIVSVANKMSVIFRYYRIFPVLLSILKSGIDRPLVSRTQFMTRLLKRSQSFPVETTTIEDVGLRARVIYNTSE